MTESFLIHGRILPYTRTVEGFILDIISLNPKENRSISVFLRRNPLVEIATTDFSSIPSKQKSNDEALLHETEGMILNPNDCIAAPSKRERYVFQICYRAILTKESRDSILID